MRNSYSYEFKLKAAKDLYRKNEMPNVSLLRRWVNAYKILGPNVLRKQPPVKDYPVHFKVDVLNFMQQTGASY